MVRGQTGELMGSCVTHWMGRWCDRQQDRRMAEPQLPEQPVLGQPPGPALIRIRVYSTDFITRAPVYSKRAGSGWGGRDGGDLPTGKTHQPGASPSLGG